MSAATRFFGAKPYAGMTRKAWVKFTGATGAILASDNITSVVRFSAGLYDVTFTNAMSGTSYMAPAATQGFGRMAGSDDQPYAAVRSITSTTLCRIATKVAAAAVNDPDTAYVEFWE